MAAPILILMTGMPSAGKSTIALELGAAFGWPVIEFIVVLCSADRDIRNARVGSRAAMRSQPVKQSQTHGYARERFTHLPADRIEIVTEGYADEAVDQAIAALRNCQTDLIGERNATEPPDDAEERAPS